MTYKEPKPVALQQVSRSLQHEDKSKMVTNPGKKVEGRIVFRNQVENNLTHIGWVIVVKTVYRRQVVLKISHERW